MNEVVLDASALMAVLREEPGAAVVEVVLDSAVISAVNLSEVQAKLVERGTPADLAWSWLAGLDLAVRDFDAIQARVAGDLRPDTRAYGLSFADRACLLSGDGNPTLIDCAALGPDHLGGLYGLEFAETRVGTRRFMAPG